MQKRVSQVTKDYCFNLINSLIDYRGDVARNSKCNDGQNVYSSDFSPNNVRRLILSGDGARIDFHVSVDGKLSKVKPFSDLERKNLGVCLSMLDYKPMLWAIADRVCSSIEEVIICTNNASGLDLSKELNFEGLLRDKYKGTDIKEAISSRYKRLAYFTIVNCDIQTLVSNTEVKTCNNPLKLVSETDFVKGCASVTKFKSDWYNYYGTTPAYSMDSKGSKLNEHFKTIKTSIEERKRKSEVDELKEARLKGISEKFDKAFKNYKGVFSSIHQLSVILKTEGTNYLSRGISELSLGSFSSPDKMKEEFSKLNGRDECESFIKNMITYSSAMYSNLTAWFFDNIIKLNSEYKLAIDLLLSTMNRSIVVPPEYASKVKCLNTEFKGINMPDSTSNICCYACLVFITDVGGHNMSKYYLKDTWMKNFEGSAK